MTGARDHLLQRHTALKHGPRIYAFQGRIFTAPITARKPGQKADTLEKDGALVSPGPGTSTLEADCIGSVSLVLALISNEGTQCYLPLKDSFLASILRKYSKEILMESDQL